MKNNDLNTYNALSLKVSLVESNLINSSAQLTEFRPHSPDDFSLISQICPPEGALTPKPASQETGAGLTCLNNCCVKRPVKS